MRKALSLLLTLLLSVTLAIAQTRAVTGTVTDESGNPIAFASVKVKNGKSGVSADANGKFTIQVKTGDVLVFSSTNATAPKEVTVGTGNVLNAVLSLKAQQIETVVVTALGVQRQAKELGYSTARVRTDELTQARVTNVASGLTGKVSGLDIRLTDNGVNPQVKINLRGNRSLTGNNAALVVLDGVPVNQQYIATLNPDDIDNITVLKGANAAALYGIDASNGVLIINTKKGGRSKLSVNYKNTTAFESISYMPDLQYQYSPNGGETGGYPIVGGYPVGGSYWDPTTGKLLPVPFENQNFGSAYNSLDYPLSRIAVGGPFADGSLIYGDFKGYKDSKRSFFQTGTNIQNDLSAQFGGKWGGMYISGQRVDTRGVVPMDKFNRTSGRINGNVTLGKFTANAAVNYSVNNTDVVGGDQLQGRQLYWNIINQPAHIRLGDAMWRNVDDLNSPANANNYINAYYPNPWWQIYHSRQRSEVKALTSSLTLSYKLLDWLTVTARSGYSRTNANAPSYIDSITYRAYAIADAWGGSNIASNYLSRKYQNEVVNVINDDWNNDAFLTFRQKFGPITATLIGGGNYRARNGSGNWYYNEAYDRIDLPTRRDSGTGGYAEVSYKRRDFGVYGDLTLGYDDWLFLHGSYRNDWASPLAREQRRFSYPGVDVSAVLHDKISFLKESKYISFLKLRGGYSQTGNVSLAQNAFVGAFGGYNVARFGAYSIFPTLNNAGGFPFGGLQGYTQNNLTVQDQLRPERTKSIEVGAELGLFRDRIRIEAAYFKQNATDQTVQAGTATSTGTTNYLLNTGEIESKGYEIDVKFSPLARRGRFSWNLSFNYSHLDNKVISILPNLGINEIQLAGSGTTFFGGGIYAVAGQPFPVIKTTDFNRDPQGRIIVDATTGLPTRNAQLINYGGTNYKDRLGITSAMTYKGFNLNIVAEYRGGAKIWNVVGSDLDFTGASANSAQTRERFVIPNSVYLLDGKYVPNTNITVRDGNSNWWPTNYNRIGAPYVNSAAFWKLREVSLGYSFPTRWLGSRKYIKSISLSAFGRNLFMLRPVTNVWTDPEFSDAGVGNAVGSTSVNQTPPTRNYGATLNVVF